VLVLVLLLLAMVGPHLIASLIGRRSPWPRRFLASAARIIGLRVAVQGAALVPPTLALANHVSWLDILVLGGATGSAFVSKADIATVPVVGWLADQHHTLYIERAARGDAHGQVRRIAEGIARDQPLTVFPEGTTGDGAGLLPFRSTLLAAVTPAAPGTSVRPVAIDYGLAREEIAWHDGEPALVNALRLLGRRGTLPVTVRLLDALAPSDDRKALARDARAAIEQALSQPPFAARPHVL
jgi:lyso-ornithine lipid O-acyltransferase